MQAVKTQVVDDLVSLASDLSIPELRSLELEIGRLIRLSEDARKGKAVAEMKVIAASVGMTLLELVNWLPSKKA